ncbi:hypothetical protein FEFB_16040 [Fructobacillus sp. EFB-N1]|uniref:hypothetical protein n=1 Tax=Fructobacillus sp. EFB-N1 TaxID=1658766 RepID=UPI00064D92BD|nr:hypothetical protein [Fructobacillus sp. EFB-N1]KMK52666.1 hypothetical protein FEFB_16040 [Fructobacillus sp. EFB-N1]
MKHIFKGMANDSIDTINNNFDELADPNRDMNFKNATVNGYLHANGDSTTQKLDVFGGLYTHDDIHSLGGMTTKKSYEADVYDYGLNAHLTRVGTTVTIRIYGDIIGEHGAFSKINWNIPLGFRPPVETDALVSVGYTKGLIKIYPDGSTWNIDQAFHTSNNNGGDNVSYGFGSWSTLDDLPS